MKLIIEIPEEVYNVCKQYEADKCATWSECVIANGTPYEEQPKDKWIPVKYRPLTEDERISFAEHYGIEYCDTVDEKTFDCPMPEDGQEILISGSWGVSIDVADNDIDDEGFIVYGLEGNGDWEGIDAWMPLLEPYKRGGEEE
jgi:hypothetical protein